MTKINRLLPCDTQGYVSTQNVFIIGRLAKLIHIQSHTSIVLQPHMTVINIGKANDQNTPDVDLLGFPNSEVVSRIHACIWREGKVYFLEDLNSINGTFLNQIPIAPANRYLLTNGDLITLGKDKLVSFRFQLY